MASARHRALPRPPASSRNPFDSSDDENDAPKASRAYQNPFDGGEDADAAARAPRQNPKNALRPPPASSKPQGSAKNPFDDDDEEEMEEKGHRERQGSLKDKLDQGTLFDEEPRFHGDVDMQERRSMMSKSPAVSAMKKVRKIRDAGAAQATKMVEGGLNQAHRLKEGSVHAFKPSETKTNSSEQERIKPSSKYMKDVNDRRAANTNGSVHARNQLLAEDLQPGAGSKGDLEGAGSGGLFETSTRPRGFNRTHYDEDQFHGSELDQRTVQELEGYAVQKSEDTTKSLQNCVRVAEEIKGDATNTLLTLHQQGEQLRRTHEVAHDIDESLTTGEKLLGSLGGMFSRTWKPKRSPAIKGPVDDPKDFDLRRKGHHLQQRTALGIGSKAEKDQDSHHRVYNTQAHTMEEKLEVERSKQDDALTDLSNVLGQLKDMTIDMGAEISRQNVAMDSFHDDLVVLGERVKDANVRGRHLLKK